MKKRLIYFLLLIVFLIPCVVKADNLTEKVDNSKKIYDFANLITDDQESEVALLINNFVEKYKMDLAIITLDNNPYGKDINSTKTYAIDFYNYNNFGLNATKDGVAVIIDKDTKDNYIATFGSAKDVYDSQKVNSINNSISTFISEENYYQMIKVYITKLSNYAKGDEEELICNDENDNKYLCKTPKVDNSKKVYDFADLLSDDEERELANMANTFINEYNMDIAMVTINENPYGVSDYGSKVYAQDFYYYNRFGINTSHDGFILLIDMANRYIYMATKGKAMLVYDDIRIDNITEVAYNYLKSGNYYSGYKVMIDKASEYAKSGTAESNEYYCIDDTGEPYKCKEKPKEINWALSLVIGALCSLIPAFIHTRKYRGIKLATNANTYLQNANIDTTTDQFLTTFTSRVRRSHDSGGSGGGGGFGGSSTSHGSGGSFGGGGRHF